jgi:phage virion morphogenesis protein
MSGTNITIEIDDAEVRAVFAHWQSFDGGEALRLVLGDIGEALKISTEERAKRQVAPDGTPWVELSPKYARRKEKKRPGLPILRRDGHLLGDMLSWQPEGNDEVVVGTNAIYGATHQFGRAKIPSRPFLGLSDEDRSEIVTILAEHLTRALDSV